MARRMYSIDQIAGGASKDISSIDLSVGNLDVLYDTTDGATIVSQGSIMYTDSTSKTVNCEYELPVVPGNCINIDATPNSQAIEISVKLYMHNIHLYLTDDSMNAYLTIYSAYSEPVVNKQELVEHLLAQNNMPATGVTENYMKIVYAIDSAGQLYCTDLQGQQTIYSDDYTVEDLPVQLGG